jgi:predicted GTPase
MSQPNYEEIRENAEKAAKTPVYIALFGQPGAGKSSLINAITGQAGLAKVGVENEATSERKDFEWNNLILSDLPGYGTAKFPAETYRTQFKIDKFDLFLCVTSGKLKEDDIAFFRELRKEKNIASLYAIRLMLNSNRGFLSASCRTRLPKILPNS